jgi:hypothetical protein
MRRVPIEFLRVIEVWVPDLTGGVKAAPSVAMLTLAGLVAKAQGALAKAGGSDQAYRFDNKSRDRPIWPPGRPALPLFNALESPTRARLRPEGCGQPASAVSWTRSLRRKENRYVRQ